ncbi:MAG: hypothetical protein ACLP4V_21775, partial [Methylocella sp.]
PNRRRSKHNQPNGLQNPIPRIRPSLPASPRTSLETVLSDWTPESDKTDVSPIESREQLAPERVIA